MTTPRAVQRTYITLILGNTLAASLIWGINTIFLLDAGLSCFVRKRSGDEVDAACGQLALASDLTRKKT